MGIFQPMVMIILVGTMPELQLAYMVGQLLGLLFTGFALFCTWNWLFLTRHRERRIGGKIIYGLVMTFWLIFAAAISFVAYNYSPAFALPLVTVIILGFIKRKEYKRLENEDEDKTDKILSKL